MSRTGGAAFHPSRWSRGACLPSGFAVPRGHGRWNVAAAGCSGALPPGAAPRAGPSAAAPRHLGPRRLPARCRALRSIPNASLRSPLGVARSRPLQAPPAARVALSGASASVIAARWRARFRIRHPRQASTARPSVAAAATPAAAPAQPPPCSADCWPAWWSRPRAVASARALHPRPCSASLPRVCAASA